MAEQHHRRDADKKLTVFGEPLWLDTLKTLGVGLMTLVLAVGGGSVLGVAGRARVRSAARTPAPVRNCQSAP